MTVELLYFDGCPSYEALLPRLRALVEHHDAGEVELRRIESVDAAERERFLGSPTVRIDGVAIEPAARERSYFGLKCRLYRTQTGASPVPPDQMIRDALRRTRP